MPGGSDSPEYPAPAGPLLREPEELDDPGTSRERLIRLAGARVLFAEHAVLQRDFPRLRAAAWIEREPALAALAPRELERAVGARIEAWLLRQAAWISVPQAGQTVVNTPITTGETAREAWRPPRYGRAAVVRTDDGPGLLDLKGVGVSQGRTPVLAAHGTGLCMLGELLRSIAFNWMISRIFEATSVGFWCVPIYGLIDTGVGARYPDVPGLSRAAILVRRAHRRPLGGIELPRIGERAELVKFEVEMLLRSYGLTSTNDGTALRVLGERGDVRFMFHGRVADRLSKHQRDQLVARLGEPPITYDGVNVQLTRELDVPGSRAQLVDFGHYQWRASFERPVASLVRDRDLRFGGAIHPDDPHFVQPDPSLHLPRELWSMPTLDARLRALDGDLQRGMGDGASLRAALADMVAHSVRGWSSRS